jgi:hypothetical protein
MLLAGVVVSSFDFSIPRSAAIVQHLARRRERPFTSHF